MKFNINAEGTTIQGSYLQKVNFYIFDLDS
jgi:hypothetical protein